MLIFGQPMRLLGEPWEDKENAPYLKTAEKILKRNPTMLLCGAVEVVEEILGHKDFSVQFLATSGEVAQVAILVSDKKKATFGSAVVFADSLSSEVSRFVAAVVAAADDCKSRRLTG